MYMPNFFEAVIYELKVNKRSRWPRKVLIGLGLSTEAVNQIVKGRFTHHVEGDTVVVNIG
jgi:hypothetical protein